MSLISLIAVATCRRVTVGQYQDLYYFISPTFSIKASVVMRVNGTGSVVGVVEFEQNVLYGPVTVRGALRGLTIGDHGFHIHRLGDMTDGCKSAGPHFNPGTWTHGAQSDVVRHVGDLGNVKADHNGNTILFLNDDRMTLHGRNNIIGRSLIVHALRDDLGRGGDAESLISGNAGARIVCGVIGLVGEKRS